MADLNFPQNPQVNDSFTIGSKTWKWDGFAWILQTSVQSLDPFTVGRLIVTTSTNSTSTTTGGAIIYGGVGIGQDLQVGGDIKSNQIHAGEVFDNNARVLTSFDIITSDGLTGGGVVTATGTHVLTLVNTGVLETFAGPGISLNRNTGLVTITNTGVLNLTAGSDITISTSTGNITISDVSTFQSVTNRGNSTTNNIYINNTTQMTGSNTGALVVMGGVYIGKDLRVDGDFYASGHAIVTTATFSGNLNSGTDIAFTVDSGTGAIRVDDISTLDSVTSRGSTTTYSIKILNTSNATSTDTGALIIAGGIGISGDINSGGNVLANSITATHYLSVGNTRYSCFTSPIISSFDPVNLDIFGAEQFRTAKYLVQIVDSGFSPNLTHSSELLVTHDNNGADTIGYITQYGIITNFGELGSWEVNQLGGILTLVFTPNYLPTNMQIIVSKHAIAS